MQPGKQGMRFFRLDLASGGISERRRTPQGGVIAKASFTRTGVFAYRTADGGTRWELRHPDDVFHPDSLATYPMAPLTVDHPGRVGPNNWKEHAIGHAGPDVRQNGDFVSGDVHLQDASAIERAESGDLKEISCGYFCDSEPGPGEYQGQKWDVRQRNIKINHIGLGPEGWGRMGPEARMQLDAGQGISGEPELTRADAEAQSIAESIRKEGEARMYEALAQMAILDIERTRAAPQAVVTRADSPYSEHSEAWTDVWGGDEPMPSAAEARTAMIARMTSGAPLASEVDVEPNALAAQRAMRQRVNGDWKKNADRRPGERGGR